MKKEVDDKQQHRTWPRKLIAILSLALIAFVASDGYFNQWKTIKRIWSWNTLELQGQNNLTWRLKAGQDFQLINISDVRTTVRAESLLVFDQPLRDSGYYRLYFRPSDSVSVHLQKMYRTLLSYDTAGTITRSIEDTKKAYHNIQLLFGLDSATARDSLVNRTSDTTKQLSHTSLSLGGDEETSVALKKLLGSPQVIVGVGIGIALSAGSDLLRGGAYCAIAKNDVFRIDSIKLGMRVGVWEGAPIDILWALKKKENKQIPDSTK